MALDNVLAVILLPIFGSLSDKTHSRFGRRMPYIFVGMILSAIVFPLIPIFFMKNNIVALIVTNVAQKFQSVKLESVLLL